MSIAIAVALVLRPVMSCIFLIVDGHRQRAAENKAGGGKRETPDASARDPS